ncbi:hypothetical protein CONCODRAFT_78130 [Conidiobolus coronatus NRRL 28638]|uniref:Centromere protein H C-terminal domain-containing protein n=1 Tax=Conidiobolus coronatus (strain ATCC 28846 / CBS 209.66 / NRRL 28638) TaxID=796925 RepID=A0A137P9Z5_CONC2|nr:hypothetical protein CONCODRAFT_78130 [Conidiobolus coronatus NRRL 28638]|eukprot:KXN71819.1 hypothetical protein CONCODRAFT_78130 [Conidiobolus coronatus NRRL 28638]
MDRIIHDNLSEGPCSNLSQEDKKFVKLHLINDFLTETLKDYELAQNLIEKFPKDQTLNNSQISELKTNLSKLIEEIKIILEVGYLKLKLNELCSEVFQFNHYINMIRRAPVMESEDFESLLNLLQFRNLKIDEYMKNYNQLTDLSDTNLDLKLKLMKLELTIKEKYDEYRDLKTKGVNRVSNNNEADKEELLDVDSEKVKEQQKQIDLLRKKSTVLYNVFKGLVLESDIDWYSDPKFFNLMREDFDL